ncbi:amidohydrolase [Alicyclobacillus sp.]|uniref:amidohydrolase n=1 Tax=Alicyclobacillus sp. TaxID=61169 RepID=UPI0025BBE8DD|nr:amidohydrolase [Alicyclobacillus sp.]MCL6517496.1 amidohydrolase [Alicyclobacillus sp.]
MRWMMIGANGYTLRQPGRGEADVAGERFDAVVVDGERVVAVGRAEDLRLQYGARVDRVMDVEGATVLPGLVDSHLHVAMLGERAMRLDLTGVSSADEMLSRIRVWARSLQPDAWVLGGGWDDNRFDDGRVPSPEALDEAAGGRPLLLTRVCRHAYLANRVAFARAGITDETPDPAGGRFGRDAEGRLNGWVYEHAGQRLLAAVPRWSEAQWRDALEAGMREALAAGITAVHTDDVRNLGTLDALWRAYRHLQRERGISLRVHALVDHGALPEYRSLVRELAQDDWLRLGCVKLFADGALGGRTAWLDAPYTDAPGWRGTPIHAEEELVEHVRLIHEAGFGAAVHAIGDAALAAVLDALEQAPPVTMRDRIVHAEIIRPDLIRRMQRLGDHLAVDIQPRFTVSDFPWVMDRVGEKRARFVCAWRTLLEAGVHVAGGSDAPIEPVAPLVGMHAAVVRRAPGEAGAGWFPEEALTPVQAARLFTHDACYADGTERHKGVIAPGMWADFTVVDRDVLRPADPDELLEARVLYTIVGGRLAHAADGGPEGWS